MNMGEPDWLSEGEGLGKASYEECLGISQGVKPCMEQKGRYLAVERRLPCTLSLQCIRDQKIPIAVCVIIAVLVSVIIALAVRTPQTCPPPINTACPDGWIGNRGKCYFFSETEGNWTSSQNNCSLLSASLAVIDSLQDLVFMMRYKGPPHYWIGLRKEQNQSWKWPNGTEFNNMFPVRGEGQCAFLNDAGVSSSRCYSERGSICSRPDDCTRRTPGAARGDTV
nr:C-type lectin domain family 2 member D-like isoform X2 [Chelonoidis abingdonii]